MLTLTRRMGQSIQVGPDIRVVVVSIGRGKVRIGIEAPRDLLILRDELVGGQAVRERELKERERSLAEAMNEEVRRDRA